MRHIHSWSLNRTALLISWWCTVIRGCCCCCCCLERSINRLREGYRRSFSFEILTVVRPRRASSCSLSCNALAKRKSFSSWVLDERQAVIVLTPSSPSLTFGWAIVSLLMPMMDLHSSLADVPADLWHWILDSGGHQEIDAVGKKFSCIVRISRWSPHVVYRREPSIYSNRSWLVSSLLDLICNHDRCERKQRDPPIGRGTRTGQLDCTADRQEFGHFFDRQLNTGVPRIECDLC